MTKSFASLLFLLLSLLAITPGCASTGSREVPQGVIPGRANMLLLQTNEPQRAWEAVVDGLDDYFVIEHERPVQVFESTMTEGRVDTLPTTGSTILEPWRCDSVTWSEKVQCTLQPIRRWASARVIPVSNGFQVEVMVYKELEAVERPEHATAGQATLRHDTSPTRVAQPPRELPKSDGWQSIGRDHALEAAITDRIRHLAYDAGCL